MKLVDVDLLKGIIYEMWGGDPAYHTAIGIGEFKTETDAKAEEACLILENIEALPTFEPRKYSKPVVYYHGENTFSYDCGICRMPIDKKDFYCRWCGAKIDKVEDPHKED